MNEENKLPLEVTIRKAVVEILMHSRMLTDATTIVAEADTIVKYILNGKTKE